jgi:hypothetical protein
VHHLFLHFLSIWLYIARARLMNRGYSPAGESSSPRKLAGICSSRGRGEIVERHHFPHCCTQYNKPDQTNQLLVGSRFPPSKGKRLFYYHHHQHPPNRKTGKVESLLPLQRCSWGRLTTTDDSFAPNSIRFGSRLVLLL